MGDNEEFLQSGVLSGGKQWVLIKSAKSAVTSGRHLILRTDPAVFSDQLNESEKMQLYSIAIELIETDKYSLTPGNWRLAVNGPKIGSRPTFHIHLIFPGPEDKLPRLVSNLSSIVERTAARIRDLTSIPDEGDRRCIADEIVLGLNNIFPKNAE